MNFREPFPTSQPIAPRSLDASPLEQLPPRAVSVNKGKRVHRQYQQAQVETASPTRLVIMLYEGAMRFCSAALEAMRDKNLPAQNENLLKAQRILGELASSLDRKAGGEVAENLFRVYMFMLEELVQGNLYDRPAQIEKVLRMLTELRDSWLEVERVTLQSGGVPTEGEGGTNVG